MSKCPHCGFDSESDSLVAEGSPCGVDGCITFNCCTKTWEKHCKEAHPEYYKQALERTV